MRRRSRASESEGRVVTEQSACVAEVMGTDLFTLTPDTVVASAVRLAAAKHIHHFLVIDEGSLTGIVTDFDLMQARQGTMVGSCMKTPVLCIAPDTSLEDAVAIMERNDVGCLPVVTGTFLVGMITRDRLAGVEGTTDDESEEFVGGLEPQASPGALSAPQTCAACGKRRKVEPQVRAAFLSLCSECAGVIPSVKPARGN